jgi:NADH dehydrogenase FAD-containing subunit
VKVKPTLQLAQHPRIFALGDIIDWKEQKQAAKALGHVSIVSNNVLSLVGLKSSFKDYKGSIEMIGLSNGKVCLLDSV